MHFPNVRACMRVCVCIGAHAHAYINNPQRARRRERERGGSYYVQKEGAGGRVHAIAKCTRRLRRIRLLTRTPSPIISIMPPILCAPTGRPFCFLSPSCRRPPRAERCVHMYDLGLFVYVHCLLRTAYKTTIIKIYGWFGLRKLKFYESMALFGQQGLIFVFLGIHIAIIFSTIEKSRII